MFQGFRCIDQCCTAYFVRSIYSCRNSGIPFPSGLAFHVDSGFGGSGRIGRNICLYGYAEFFREFINTFALVLAIGIVVDNAIVVVEAVHVKMQEGFPPYRATVIATKEIAGAVVAITLVMSAVFIPVAFLDGPVGVFTGSFP